MSDDRNSSSRVRASSTLELERRDAADSTAGYSFRVPTTLELRAAKDDEPGKMPGLRGYTAVFESWSEPLGFFEDFREKIAKGAFAKTITESDIRGLFNHEPSNVLARSRPSGANTLALSEDSTGLEFDIGELPDSTLGRDLAESVERQDVDGCSFGFRTVKDEWDYDVSPEDAAEGIEAYRTLVEVRLFDVGPVTYPAYPETTAEVRSKIATLRAAKDARAHAPELGELYLTSYRQRMRELEARGALLFD